MIVITQYSGLTHTAQIRGSVEKGYKLLYKASCTAGDEAAAKTVVRKYYGNTAADRLTEITPSEAKSRGLLPPTSSARKPHNPVRCWTFS